jgi:tRNA(Ile)-lysidine synthase
MYLNKINFKIELSALLADYQKRKFLLAISGGADSMVLANLCKSLDFNFEIAHINYKLRGEDSDLDEKIVRDFCEKNEVKFHLYKVSDADKKPKNSVQIWARNIRYTYFDKIKSDQNLDYVITAHHLNDEVETFIINLSRASGLKGLSGIPKNKNGILRPLLKFSKGEIYNFAEENSIEFREDKSNQKSDYLRNFIRHEIMPQLLKTNERFLENFSKTLTYLENAQDFISSEIDEKRKMLSQEINSKIVFDKKKLKLESDFVKFELLQKYGFTDLNEISKLFTSLNGSEFLSKTYRLEVTSNEIIISSLNKIEKEIIPIYIGETSEIHISKYAVNYNLRDKIWNIDSTKVTWPIILRKPLSSDIFQPIGMKGNKSVQKFIKELKLSELDFQPMVLADSKGNILGIVPNRQNGNFLDNGNSKNLKICL